MHLRENQSTVLVPPDLNGINYNYCTIKKIKIIDEINLSKISKICL